MTLVASNTLAAFRASAKDKICIQQINFAFLNPLQECFCRPLNSTLHQQPELLSHSTRHHGNKSQLFYSLAQSDLFMGKVVLFLVTSAETAIVEERKALKAEVINSQQSS